MKTILSIFTLVIGFQAYAGMIQLNATGESLATLTHSNRIRQAIKIDFDLPNSGHADAELLLVENLNGALRASLSLTDQNKNNYVWTIAENVSSLLQLTYKSGYLQIDVDAHDGIKEFNLMPLINDVDKSLNKGINSYDSCAFNRGLERICEE